LHSFFCTFKIVFSYSAIQPQLCNKLSVSAIFLEEANTCHVLDAGYPNQISIKNRDEKQKHNQTTSAAVAKKESIILTYLQLQLEVCF